MQENKKMNFILFPVKTPLFTISCPSKLEWYLSIFEGKLTMHYNHKP